MHQRQKKILDMLQSGRVEIRSAALELGVTEMTLRRDLKELENQKLVLYSLRHLMKETSL